MANKIPMPPRYIAVPFTGGGTTVLPIPNPTLSASVVSSTQINLAISYSGPPAPLNYSFESSLSVSGPFSIIGSGASSSLGVTGLSPNTTYFFQAKVQVVDGRFSNYTPVVFKTTLQLAAPAAPANLNATAINQSEIDLTWNVVSGPGTISYNVYRDGLIYHSGITTNGYADTGLNPSETHSYTVSAQNSTGEGPQSNTDSATTLAAVTPGNGVKFIFGHGLTPNNQFWNSTGGQAYRNSVLPSIKANAQLNIIEMIMSWADMEGATRGDYSVAFNNIDAVLADAAAIKNKKVMVIVKGWLTYFNLHPPATPSINDAGAWPLYVRNNGWVQAYIQAGFGRSQLAWDIDDIWAAYGDLMVAIGQRYDSHPNFLALGFQDETEAITTIDKVTQPAPWSSGQTVMNGTHFNTKLLALHYRMSDAMPNTMVYVPWNFLPPGGAEEKTAMAAHLNGMLSTRPGKWLFGGPDPWLHNTTYHQMACGIIPGTGDIRTKFANLNNVEQGTPGGSVAQVISKGKGDGTTPSVSPLNTPGACQMFIWPYIPTGANGGVDTIDTVLAGIAAVPGFAPLPTVGTYNL